MATRANIVLKNAETTLWLYRHWDGYPAIAGANLAKVIKLALRNQHGYASLLPHIAETLLAERDTGGRSIYELTSGKHGDIQWLYQLTFRGDAAVTVSVSERNLMTDAWKRHPAITVWDLRSLCARELLAMRKRIHARRKADAKAA